MSDVLPPSRTDRIIHRLRDHPLIAIVIVAAIATIGIAQTKSSVEALLPKQDTTYAALRNDLQLLDAQLEALKDVKPELLVPALSGAGETARKVCTREPGLSARGDGLAVRTTWRVCPFVHAVDTLNALLTANPDRAENPDANLRDAALLIRYQAEGVKTFLRDSAGALYQ